MGVFSMLDEFTLEEVIKCVERRIEKLNLTIRIYNKDSTNYLIYKNLIMELTNLKCHLNNKRGVKSENDN
jgi:hypothetical protein